MARQMLLEGIVYSVLLIAIIVGLAFIVVKTAIGIRKRGGDYIDLFLGGMVYLCIMFFCSLILPTSILQIVNPEYYVIKNIIGIFN